MHTREYNYLVVGSGLFGAVFAHEMKKTGKKCLVIEKRNHTGGNTWCRDIDNIIVHQYGPHIFHTNDERIWNYVNSFVKFNRFINAPLARYKTKIYNLPFNMNTFYQLWGVTTPEEAKAMIQKQVSGYKTGTARNLEEQALAAVGKDIYEIFIKGYSEKQWGKKANELPPFLLKRIPLRFNFDNNYFDDKYQGIPIGGYNKLIDKLLEGIEVKLSTDFHCNRPYFDNCAAKVVYTGRIDEYFDYCLGVLEYRSLEFKHEHLETPNFQGNAQVNFTDIDISYTRIIEHKHFEFGKQPTTIITREYPCEGGRNKEPFYPVNDVRNDTLSKKYKQIASSLQPNVIYGGRLAEFRYYDMHQVIAAALKCAETECHTVLV